MIWDTFSNEEKVAVIARVKFNDAEVTVSKVTVSKVAVSKVTVSKAMLIPRFSTLLLKYLMKRLA